MIRDKTYVGNQNTICKLAPNRKGNQRKEYYYYKQQK